MRDVIGRVELVDVRSVWSSEPLGFTPWLAEPDNLTYYLGVPLGLDLEVMSVEKRVGRFSADILCRDKSSNSLVVIENQLEETDHRHLGQLLTYAAGLEANTVIWIAPKFCPEHSAALHWLNDLHREKLRVFGVQLEVLSISDSPPAPRFTALISPKGWNSTKIRPVSAVVKAHSEGAARRFEYWQTFLASLRLQTRIERIPAANTLGNLRFDLRGRDLWITVYNATSLGRVGRIGVFVRGSAAFGELLFEHRNDIEGKFGANLTWTGGEQWDIAIATDADPADRTDWPRQHSWLAGHLDAFLRTFRPYANSI